MPQEERKGANYSTPNPGPFLAKVVSHLDPSYMGSLEVQLLHESGNDEDREGQLRVVKHLNPFYGTTSLEFVGESPDTHNETQKAYGMWFVPPDIGTIVACIFINGDTRKGYWFGCVQDEDMDFSIPGFAATEYVVDDSRQTDKEKSRVPTTEYNKIIHPEVQSDTTKKLKPEHPFAKALEDQGLLKDDIRGITTSSGRREVPSMVFGISTPGPTDKTGKQGKVGKHEHKVAAAFISRLGGSSFVMDDGDDKWERKTLPTDGPPEYVSVEAGETALRDRPHNELIRLRTRTGHQILLHNSEDLIYIGNSRGTAWIEITSDGKIDIFAEDSINIRTKKDFNLYCDRDFNLEVGRNFNTKVHGEMHTHVLKDSILIVDENQKIHIKKDVDKTYDKTYKHTVKDNVDKVYQKNFTHTVFNSVNENFASQSGIVKVTTGGSMDVVHNGNLKITHNGTVDHTVTGYRKLTTGGGLDINTTGSNKFTASSNTEVKSGGSNITSASTILNNTTIRAPNFDTGSGSASTAAVAASASAAEQATEAGLPKILTVHTLPDLPKQDDWKSLTDIESILRRIPTYEPYPHHENLEPTKYKSDITDRDSEGRYEGATSTLATPAEYWRKYSTSTDTFRKEG
jgi:hypothetical protein